MPIFEPGPHFIERLQRGTSPANPDSGRVALLKAQSLTTVMSGAAGFFMPTTW
jgi:hypothetical protein